MGPSNTAVRATTANTTTTTMSTLTKDILVLRYPAAEATGSGDLGVTPRQLEKQLGSLIRRGYRGTTFTQALAHLPVGKILAVTFDGGPRSVLELAGPVLMRLGLPGTVFVVTSLVRDGEEPPDAVPHDPEPEMMSWADLAALRSAGWEIGSLSRTHQVLTTLTDHELADELRGSREDLRRLAGGGTSIAYPFGEVDARVAAAARDAGFLVGAGSPGGRPPPPVRLNWPRLSVGGADRGARFALKTSPALRRLRAAHEGPVPVALPPELDGAGSGLRPRTQLVNPKQPDAAPARVAVIVPCFNHGTFVVGALNSIAEAEPIEVVVVDDASTDPSTVRVLDELREEGICVVRHEVNQGLGPTRNTGVANARAPYVFTLDSDDILPADALAAMADRLDDMPGVAACYGDTVEFGGRSSLVPHAPRLDPYRVAYRNEYPSGAMFRRDAIEAVGGWENVSYEDWDMWMTLAESGYKGVHMGPRAVCKFYRVGEGMLAEQVKRHRENYEVLRERHPRLFEELGSHRQLTDLDPIRRALYPILFGGRPPRGIRATAKRVLGAVRRSRVPGPPDAGTPPA